MEHPLPAFDKLDQFKLILFDTGLLKHMAGIDNSAILLKSDYQFKGPLTENYVLQQLRGQFEVEPRYYSDKNGKIDFVLQNGTEIIPVEAKGGKDKSEPSLSGLLLTAIQNTLSVFPSAGIGRTEQSPTFRLPRRKDKRPALILYAKMTIQEVLSYGICWNVPALPFRNWTIPSLTIESDLWYEYLNESEEELQADPWVGICYPGTHIPISENCTMFHWKIPIQNLTRHTIHTIYLIQVWLILKRIIMC